MINVSISLSTTNFLRKVSKSKVSNSVLLMMSSGRFGGVDIEKIKKS